MKIQTNSAWAITREGLFAAKTRMDKAEAVTHKAQIDKRPKTDWFGQDIDQPYDCHGSRVIPIRGVLLNGAEPIYKLFGFTDYEDIAADLDDAEDSGVKGIVLDIDSPGGGVVGCHELAKRIQELGSSGITVAARTSNEMCSAAYYLAAGSTFIAASPSSVIGSIGVILQVVSFSDMLTAEGIKVYQFTSGIYKAAGSKYSPVTDEHQEFFSGVVADAAGHFFSHVQENRGAVGEEAMQGQWFTGMQGMQNGLCDDVPEDIEDLCKMLR